MSADHFPDATKKVAMSAEPVAWTCPSWLLDPHGGQFSRKPTPSFQLRLYDQAGLDAAVAAARAEDLATIQRLREELTVTDKLLEQRERVLDAIPACPAHGPGCVPHAMEWIERARAFNDAAAIRDLKPEGE